MFSIPRSHRLMAGALTLAALAQAADYSTWSHYRAVTVNTSALGLAAPVKKVPLLVRFNAANHADMLNGGSQILAGGADIRVTKADGTTDVPFEIEQATTGANGALALWILADSVGQNSATAASFRVYWGKAGATTASNGKAVFDTANGYVAAWHMNGTTNEVSSTAHAFDASPIVAPTVEANGAIGGARHFDGTQHMQVVGSAASALDLKANTTYTFSAWVRSDSINPNGDNTGHVIVNKGDHQWSLAIFGATAPNRHYEIATKVGGQWNWRQATTAATTDPVYAGDYANANVGKWRHMVGTWDGTTLTAAVGRIYLDGVLQKETIFNAGTNPAAGQQAARDVHIGALSNEGQSSTNATGSITRHFVGAIDEITISKTARSADWIKLSYENQKAAATITTIGATQTPGPAPVGWTKARSIVLNTSATGANVKNDVYNFPVLVRLTSEESTILTEAQANGADIRFLKGDSATVLPHSIESWSATGAAIWVKVDTIKGNNSTQKIHMQWGNSGATNASNAAAVFDSANGYISVYHMNGAASETNVVGHAELNATAVGTVPAVAGLIGNARSFSGVTENHLTVANSATGRLNLSSETDYTLSAWVYSEETTLDNRGIFNKGNDQWLIGVYGGGEEKFYDVMTRGGGSWNQASTEPTPITTATGVGVWRHVVGVWKGSGTPQDTARIYINGVLANTTFFNDIGNESSGRNMTTDVYIGVLMEGGNLTRPYHGRIDQVTASKVFRDSNWVKLAYENQKPGNSLVNIGTFIPAQAPSAPTAVTAAGGTAVGSVNVSWTAPSAGTSPITTYTVTANPGTATCTATAPATTCTVTGLTVTQSYTFTVTATSAAGTSAASVASNPVTPTGLIPGGSFVIRMDGSKPYSYSIPASLVSSTERLTMTIVNVHGKRVWSKTITPAQSKVSELTWDGRNANGMRASAGMYIVRLEATMNGQTITSEHKGVNLKP